MIIIVFAHYRNIIFLVKSFPKMKKANPDRLHLLVMNSYRPDQNNTNDQTLIAGLHPADRIPGG